MPSKGGASTKPSVDMHRTESIIHINKDNLTIKNKNLYENNPEFEDKKEPYKEEYTSDDNTNNTPPEIRLTPPNFDQGSTEPLKDSTNGIIPGEDNLTMPTILSDFISQKDYLVTLVNEGQSIDQEKQQLIKTLLGNIDKCIKGYLKNFNISKKLKDLLPNKHLSTFQQEEILNTLNKDYYRLLNGFIQELKEMRAK